MSVHAAKIGHAHSASAQSVYVLSADGSELYLLDPSKPGTGEHPPPYAPRRVRASTVSHASVSAALAGRSPTRLLRPLLPVRGVSDAGPGPSSPERERSPRPVPVVDERTPLLPRVQESEVEAAQRPRWRTMFKRQHSQMSALGEGSGSRPVKRYWRTLISGAHWGAAFHLLVINFPFALLIWPLLFAGTLAGTALLITLPIGVLVWFLTLLLTRTSARIEMALQRYYHGSQSQGQGVTRPIFIRVKEIRSPVARVAPLPLPLAGQGQGQGLVGREEVVEWERGFAKNTVAMFSDHYSYKALSYLILTKALLTLALTIILWPLFVLCAVLVLPLPGYLIFVRRVGRWQAGIAREALA